MNSKAIGILGGMGPEASVYMHKMLIDLSILEFNAKKNDHFPAIILDSVPVPDFITSEKNKIRALKMLKKRVAQFDDSTTLSLSLACNTAHALLEDLQKMTEVPFVSMIEEVSDVVVNAKISRVGLLATPTTLRLRLYQNALSKRNVDVLEPTASNAKRLEKAIRNVIGGKFIQEDTLFLKDLADNLKEQGAGCIVLGCTELPLIFPKEYSLPVFNCIEILSLSLLRKYYKSHKMSLQI